MCNCKSSLNSGKPQVKQVVKKVKNITTSKPMNKPQKTISRKISYRRPI